MKSRLKELNNVLKDVLKSSQVLGFKIYVANAHEILYQFYKELGDYDKSLQYHEQFKMHNDSVYNINATAKFNEVDIIYQAERDKVELAPKRKRGQDFK